MGTIYTPEGKAKFARELAAHVMQELLADINAGKLPEEWDGQELRELLAIRFERAAFLHRDKNQHRRWRDFKNEILVKDL